MVPEMSERILYRIIIFSLLGIAIILFCGEVRDNQLRNSPISPNQIVNQPTTHASKESIVIHSDMKQKCKEESPKKQRASMWFTEFILTTHSKNTKYLHSAVGLKYEKEKGYGLFAKKSIKAGIILFAERPLLEFDAGSLYPDHSWMILQINKLVSANYHSDPEFSVIWNELAVNLNVKQWAQNIAKNPIAERALLNMAKVFTNQVSAHWHSPWHVYALLSRINFGLPQNVAVIIERNVCFLVSTKDIAAGTELLRDYFFDWFNYEGMDANGKRFEDLMTDRKLKSNLLGIASSKQKNPKLKLLKALNSNRWSKRKKHQMAVKELYPNGIIGKLPQDKDIQIVQGGNVEMIKIIKNVIAQILEKYNVR